jgi:NADPH:quinone reductase-like Zn-dependent oxidoreductase
VVLKVGSTVSKLKVGDPVAFIQPGAMRTTTRIASKLLQGLPHGTSFEEAASMPVDFIAAYHTLIEVARLKQGEAVLLHATQGGKVVI